METPSNRDFNSISPSAKGLLYLKGHTTLPYCKEAVALLGEPEPFQADPEKAARYWARIVHFEQRYRSIDQLLKPIDIKNIVEISAGFSFRGLAMVADPTVYYIDTDLPDLIAAKKSFIEKLHPEPIAGHLDLEGLNALDENTFRSLTARFPPGPVAIINEGLLMYLDTAEKEQLCGIIRRILQQSGGYWITADIYIREDTDVAAKMYRDDALMQFLKAHQIEEKKFSSFEEAESFFEEMGFVIDEVAQPNHALISSLPQFMAALTPDQKEKLKEVRRTRATWRLRLAD
ncbi:class I SAM-dependent methyltransferase [Chitinophaga sp. sic0106]|uniref:class I SAM-dependent methyltransferase n=1 Tax=Chitinophaga sp. sic0106 TaxID=2854785 RepID=UPI001C47A157|nr:class I SAM-dependent methyltransferase [Chitinophaga sp. sic0106]MBV7530057.1 class I SAM-dependent methyltransferase [Chitinophaga sp. sic0106]